MRFRRCTCGRMSRLGRPWWLAFAGVVFDLLGGRAVRSHRTQAGDHDTGAGGAGVDFPGVSRDSAHCLMATLLGAIAVLSTLSTISTCPVVIWLAESLPAPIRSGRRRCTPYAVAIATFGRTTQYAVTWLIRATGSPLAPAWYWTVSLVVGLIAILVAHESRLRNWRSGRRLTSLVRKFR